MAKIDLISGLLDANEVIARNNRGLFEENRVYVINLMGVPGSGKTTILENIILGLKNELSIGVVEGDLYTTKDAERITRLGIPVVQINTNGACHLDAVTVRTACLDLALKKIDLLIIENIGNLVCPAEFNLGENTKVMVMSVTEGNDKPLKYPLIFRQAKLIIINKMDLISYTDFNLKQFTEDIYNINSETKIIPVSARTGESIYDLTHWLISEVKGRYDNS